MKYVFGFCALAAFILLVEHRVESAHMDGFKLGMRHALNTNPVSEELEMTCAGLWVGEQNKKRAALGL